MKKILIKGYYGFKNLGDDFLLYSILDTLNQMGNYEISIVSAGDQYKELFEKFTKLKCKVIPAVKWKRLLKKWYLINCDYWIIGGGGLFPSEKAANIPNWYNEIQFAKKFGTLVCMYGIDINSINENSSKIAWKEISKLVNFIVCRNKKTKKMLDNLGCRNVYKSSDITFGLKTQIELSNSKTVLNKIGCEPQKYALWSIPMLWSDRELQDQTCRVRYEKLVKTLQDLANDKKMVEYTHVFLPFFYEKDLSIIQDIVKGVKGHSIICDDGLKLKIDEKRLLFKYAGICVSMRFHAAMFSIYHKTKGIYISYADKTSDVIKENNLADYLIEYGFSKKENFYREFDLATDRLYEILDRIFSESENISEILEQISTDLKYQAKKNKNKLIEWID